MSPWTSWSQCSVSCGLGSLFRQRDVLREALPGGACGGAQFDSRACFPRACPVDGHWSPWTHWSDCDVACGGGLSHRNRSCSPPKNGGQDCEGPSQQSHSCHLQPCTADVGTQTGCTHGLVLVSEEDCQKGKVKPCPPTCPHLGQTSNCTSACVAGCRCPPGLYLSQGRCVAVAQCGCQWGSHSLEEGQVVRRDPCTTCVCAGGRVSCNSSSCVQSCHWSAWSSWTPCDVKCGAGLQQRFRSPLVPAGAARVQPCPGDSGQSRRCLSPCVTDHPEGEWSPWTIWSECSKTCFSHVDYVGVRRRFRNCHMTSASLTPTSGSLTPPSASLTPTSASLTPTSASLTSASLTPTHSSCEGDAEEQEPCNTYRCPVIGGWSLWSPWSLCSSDCDSGVQTRERSCSSPAAQYGGETCPGPHIQTRDCNAHPCTGVCPQGMVSLTSAQCEAQGGACPRVCLDMTPAEVECATTCYDGCYCAPGFYIYNRSCVPLASCPCYHQGALVPAGASLPHDACNNCTCSNGEMHCGTAPCPVDCGWSSWTQWSSCSRTCDVGVRRRYRSGTNPPPAFGGRPCRGERVGMDTCSVEPCFGVKEPWSPWSLCSVTCGGGYRSRTRGPIRTHGTAQQFSACNLQPCGGGRVCPPQQQWAPCVTGPVTCSDVLMNLSRNCTPGCLCPPGMLLQDAAECVPQSECRCDIDGKTYYSQETVPVDCNNCTCEGGRLVNCSQLNCEADSAWSQWTPWGLCSVSCGTGRQSRYRFCSGALLSSSAACDGPQREDQVCVQQRCDRDGGWGQWTNWTQCSKTCGGGVRSRRRECDSPTPEGDGNYCEGLGTEVSSCNTLHCPVFPCTEVPGSAFSSCGPSCPRSCDDLAHCAWRCEPGCYCTEGKVLSSNGTVCVDREDCPCLDLSTGQRLQPGHTRPSPDGHNNCTCVGGTLNCTRALGPVDGGWCEWSDWTPCSRTCGAESVSRYRSCVCPEPREGGARCPGEQEVHSGVGVQIQRQPCPLLSFCPVHGAWSPWSVWSECDGCEGASTRTRQCSSPPARFGGLPCLGETRQSRACQDNSTVCSDCGGGQVDWPCGRPCPRSCADLQGDTDCQDSPECSRTCGCPGDTLLQDGVCVRREDCRCSFYNGSAPDAPDSSGSWQVADPGESVITDCTNCSCEAGVLQCDSLPGCRVDGSWSQWSLWTECSMTCGGGVKTRKRLCNNPAPQSGGRGCVGVADQRRECNTHICTDSGGPWLPWSLWSECTVSCGGGHQSRFRVCKSPPCSGPERQSKTCHTHVCLEEGCPPGRLYRECERGEGCPFSCSQISGRESCYSDGCEEGCHCPPNTYQHQGDCLQECPCLVDQELLRSLQSVSVSSLSSLHLYNISEGFVQPYNISEGSHHISNISNISEGSEGLELQSGDSFVHDCSTCECMHGQWNCSLEHCPVDGGLSSWGPWSPCSLSCGGLGTKSRFRSCTQPAPAHGGRACRGAGQESTFCQAPDCPVLVSPTEEPALPDEDLTFSTWSSWSSCSKTCSEAHSPATKSRHRQCLSPPCQGSSHQEKTCNLPQCTDSGPCLGPHCSEVNCSWTEWAEWGPCSRSCGVGQQLRIRTFHSPGPNGSWCEDVLGGNEEQRFCNIKPCRVDGGWSRWSPWSRCDKRCGGGRSIRTRSCSSPPPKNGGRKCEGDKNQVRPCNTRPCEEQGCPPGQEFVLCADHCPQRCSDLQLGLECQSNSECQPGCRCPTGSLEQGGVCVQLWQCDCLDAQGQEWAAGSSHTSLCNNCSCSDGQLLCTNQSCGSPCAWSSWSLWSPCSTTCGAGLRTRYRSLIPESEGGECQFEEVQHKSCDPGPCPPLCLHDLKELSVGDSWLQGECEQCTCTPEGPYCQDIDCRVDGGWTPWSEWSDCSVTCGGGSQLRTRACINPPPRNNGSGCSGDERDSRGCHGSPCLDELCPWSSWSSCSQSCGAGSMSRRRECVCEEGGEGGDEGREACPAHVQETQLCYRRPCPDCPMSPWTEWSSCSCVSQRQQRHRVALAPATGGQQCSPVESQSRACSLHNCTDCPAPFLFSECVSPCEKHCSLAGRPELCPDLPQCTPGCYCPPGLLHQNGSCVAPHLCGCVYPQGDPPSLALVPQKGSVSLGCSQCFCQDGTLECDMRGCQVVLSEWSDWTPCSPCQPPSSSSFSWETEIRLVSLQRRFRACLDPDSGLPVPAEHEHCVGELQEQRLCPEPHICTDQCQWSTWSSWTVCADPCSGGVRQRYRWTLASPPGPHCRSQQTQSQSCNTGLCPGERCEDRGRSYQESCANQCPRSCTDLWEHVQCLQGVCHPGCRCPQGQLLQDGVCVPITQCRCGVPSGNGTLEYKPKDRVTADCNSCVCVNGSLVCTERPCPVYETWSTWSSCSVTCGRGQRLRTRLCQQTEGGPPCEATTQTEGCALVPCPAGCVLSDWASWTECSASCGGGVSVRNKTVLQEPEEGGAPCPQALEQHKVCNSHGCRPDCPSGQQLRPCGGSCPHTCEDLWTHTQCVEGACTPGCACPPGQVLFGGVCVAPTACPCSPLSLPLAFHSRNSSLEELPLLPLAFHSRNSSLEELLPPGTRIQHLCNTCLCESGRFSCTQQVCDVDCEWSSWSPWSPCSVSCGTGEQTSHRLVLKPQQFKGAPCDGPSQRSRSCRAPDCACPEGEQWKRSGDQPLCERSCLHMYGPLPEGCNLRSEAPTSEAPPSTAPPSEACVCEEGRYRLNSTGACVIPALCPCLHRDVLHQPGSQWEDGCSNCRCVNGRTLCKLRCSPLQCEEDEVKVEEPGNCCPVCRRHFPGEPGPECRLYTELRNITKGECRLDNVEVSFCRGRCLSKTDVILEEPYLRSVCDCCSYRLDPQTPVLFLSLPCPNGDREPVVLPRIHSCECTSCQGGDLSRR
ncbi:unnamed protein product [Knipowitschia caucasica]